MADNRRYRKKSLLAAARIGRIVGEHKVIVDPDILAGYAKDESEAEPVLPDVAIRAEDIDDVVATLKLAERFEVPVTPRGGGTGKSGGAVAIRGGIVISLAKLCRIEEINKADLLAVVQPGVVTGELQAEVEREGLFFPPDPASLETCVIGGNVAENAGGPRAFKYGVTREYVFGLDAVLMGGGRISTGRRTVKGVAGYDLTALMVGSEGTLAVFTGVTLRLLRLPKCVATLLARFDDEVSAGRAVARIVEAGLVPRVLELLDSACVETARKEGKMPIPEDTGALLLIEVDGEEGSVELEVERMAAALDEGGARDVLAAQDEAQRSRLWAARRELSELIKKRAAFKLSEDVAVPRSRLAEALQRYRKAGAEHGVEVASYGHAGDGNLHVNVLWNDPDLVVKARETVDRIVRISLDLGGTITGEHGVGHLKKKYLMWEQSREVIGLQRKLKRTFDPKGLLNPGKIF